MENTKNVLIIDDEPAMTTYLSTLLEDHGFVLMCTTYRRHGKTKGR